MATRRLSLPLGVGPWCTRAFSSWGLWSRERLEWYLAMARLTRDGVPVFDAVQTLAREFEKIHHPLTALLHGVVMGLRGESARVQGAWGSMSGSMNRATNGAKNGVSLRARRTTLGLALQGWVPMEEALLIEAADLSGDVALGLESAARHLGERCELQSTVARALLKPVGYGVALLGLMVYLSLEIMPQFERYKARALWPRDLQLLAYGADHVLAGVLAVTLLGLVMGLGLGVILPRWCGGVRDRFDRWVFPFDLYASLSAAQLLSAMAGFVSAGLPFALAVEQISRSATPYLSHQCERLLLSLKLGQRPEKALASWALIAPQWRWMLVAHGMNANTAVSIRRMAEHMQARVKTRIEFIIGQVLANAMLLGVGVVVFWVYSSMLGLVQGSA